MMDETFKALMAERDRALAALDLDWARKLIPEASCDETLLIAIHKARYECTSIPDALRRESRLWLSQRGYRRVGGLDFPPENGGKDDGGQGSKSG